MRYLRTATIAAAAISVSIGLGGWGCPASDHPGRGAALTSVAAWPDAQPVQTPTGAGQAIGLALQRGNGEFDASERALLGALYERGEPLWTDVNGRPTAKARDALSIMAAAPADGLNAADYSVEALRRRLAALEAAAAPARAAAFDVALSAAMLRYFRHLHLGLVDPRTIGFKLDARAEQHDFVSLLGDAIANDRLAATAHDLAPPVVQYRLLRDILMQYRTLAAGARLDPLPPHSGAVRPGSPYQGLLPLYQRLVAFGDLSRDTPLPRPGSTYDEPIVEAVKRFQERHNLEPDGILGAATYAALQVTPAARVRQLELALERLRWLPDLDDRRFIALNIPMFHLWAWDSVPPSGAPTLGMRAIVGRALRTKTPVFADDMRAVIFRPYWNVPHSIVRHEILPLVVRDPGYLDRHDMELVRGEADEGTVVGPSAANLKLLGQGRLRMRQRPGPRNALGLVKFDFPNEDNVYMHGTPMQELFGRARRDFSHGCVRVEDPVMLAEWVLKDEPGWTRERIVNAMSGKLTTSVMLSRPIQVILFYITAVVMPEDGTVRFAPDIYGHDAALERALRRRAK
jgi:murein L,D-transpeptidase YcbB/YkuD